MSTIILKLQEGAKQLGLCLNAGQFEQIEGYLALLQKWNRVFNLTAITKLEEMLTHHILDSLAVGKFIEAEKYLDVGTGAGLPGVILAILFPEKQFTLLDSNSKKTSFIKQAAHQLGIGNVEVIHSRIEAYVPDALFDGVISRAFSSLDDFISLCARFLKSEGVLLAMKGPKGREEAKPLRKGCEIHTVHVPFLAEERLLLAIPRTLAFSL